MTPVPLQRFREALESHGSKIVPSGSDTFMVQCPAHDDRNPSLSVKWGDRAVLLYCHAGCERDSVVAALGLTMKDLFLEREIQYAYTDFKGKTLRTVHRSPEKNFRQSGQTKGTATLYRLPEVLEAVKTGTPVYFVEGEKDVEHLRLAGAVGTTLPGGANNVKKGDFTPLMGAEVRVIPDQDAPGEKWARDLAKCLSPLAKRLTFWRVPTGKDFSDTFTVGQGLEDLQEFVPEWLTDVVPLRRVVLTRLSSIKAERVSWLWKDRIPQGEITVLGGREGEGKSTLAALLAARVTRGTLDGDLREPREVLWVTAEDSPAKILRPRLLAANADTDRVVVVSAAIFTGGEDALEFPHDIDQLRAAVLATNAALIVVDPLMSVLAGGLDTHKDRDIRKALDPLKRMTEETGVSVLALHHVNKSSSMDFRNALLGARAFSAVPRSVLGVLEDRESGDPRRKVLTLSKSNLVNRLAVPGLAFTVENTTVESDGERFDTGAVVFQGEDSRSTEDLMRALGETEDGERKETEEWLRDFLLHAGGSARPQEAINAGRREGYSESGVKRASRKLQVVKVKRREYQGGSEWVLPEFHVQSSASAEPQETPVPEVQEVLEETARTCLVRGCEELEDVTTILGGRSFGVCAVHATEDLGIAGDDLRVIA